MVIPSVMGRQGDHHTPAARLRKRRTATSPLRCWCTCLNPRTMRRAVHPSICARAHSPVRGTAMRRTALAVLAAISVNAAGAGSAPESSAPYSPYAAAGGTKRLLWGDTHVHSSYSTDAGMVGCRLGPDQVYRFARGEEVTS